MTRVGRWTCSMSHAVVADLPVPVAPRRTTSFSPALSREVSSAIAAGWSPEGVYSETTSMGATDRLRSVTGRMAQRYVEAVTSGGAGTLRAQGPARPAVPARRPGRLAACERLGVGRPVDGAPGRLVSAGSEGTMSGTSSEQRGLRSGPGTRRPADPAGRPRDEGPPPPPWRTEGMPERPEPPQGPRWGRVLLWVGLGWLVLFLLTSLQDASTSRVETISYTEFRAQVEAGNVERVYSRGESIEGVLVEPAPLPAGEDDAAETY